MKFLKFLIALIVISSCGLYLFYYLELHDFSMVVKDGDKIISLAKDRNPVHIGNSINLLCRNSQPFALVVKWAMPYHRVLYVNKGWAESSLDDNWFYSGSSLALKNTGKHPPASILLRPGSNMGLSDFFVITNNGIETLVSKPLHKNTLLDLQNIFRAASLDKKCRKIAFNIDEQNLFATITKQAYKSKTITELCGE